MRLARPLRPRRSAPALAVAAVLIAAPVAGAVDRTRPSLTGIKVTPTSMCISNDGYSGAGYRQVFLTLSEPARVTIHVANLVNLVQRTRFPSYTTASLDLPAGTSEVSTGRSPVAGTPPVPSFFDEEPVSIYTAVGFQARDVAGNTSPLRWYPRLLFNGEAGSGRGPGTTGCPR